MTTDNRANEPTDEQVEAAARAMHESNKKFYPGMFQVGWEVLSKGDQEGYLDSARAALEAAAGIAPQAESEHEYLLKARALHQTNSGLPSSTVDEDSVRLDVVRMAKNVYDRYKSELPIHNEVQAAIEKYVGDYPPKNIND